MRVRFTCLTFAALALGAPASAAPVKPSDFAYGLELERMESPALHAFELPEAVLRALVDRELGDLCVFDDSGRQLAHGFRRAGEAPVASEIEVPSYYPLEVERAQKTGDVEVTVQRDPAGAITRAYTRSVVAADRRVEGYLLDLGKISGANAIEALTLSLEAQQPFTLEAVVETSEDLAHFTALGGGTLAHLEREGQKLRRETITFPATRSPYLRVTLVEPPAGLQLSAIRATAKPVGDTTERRILELQGKAVDSPEGQLFAYELVGAFAPDQYDVGVPSSTSLVEAALEVAAKKEGPYRELDRAVFRRGATSPRPLASADERFLRLRVSDKGGGVRDEEPVLRLGYAPPRLLFAAEQSNRYLLAYGSGVARCKEFDDSALANGRRSEIPTRDTVRTARTRTLSGEAALKKPSDPQSLRVYVLWAVLLVAVAGLAAMAAKLVRKV